MPQSSKLKLAVKADNKAITPKTNAINNALKGRRIKLVIKNLIVLLNDENATSEMVLIPCPILSMKFSSPSLDSILDYQMFLDQGKSTWNHYTSQPMR